MATEKDIPTDLALEIAGSQITPERFLRAVRAFFGLVQEVTANLAGNDGKVEWAVKVKEGSAVIGVDPAVYTVAPSTLDAIRARVLEELETLETDGDEPTHFPEAAMRYARDLANIVGTDEDDDTRLRIWVNKRAKPLTHKIVANAAEILKAAYEDYGTIEGRLQVVSEEGRLHCNVRDPVSGRAVRCVISEDMLPRAFAAFRKRVEVSGPIRYRKDGTPTSIKVQSLDVFPDKTALPSPREMRGILKQAK
jgi:hypothetical protein